MCSHHELQRRKTGLDGEIRQLEAEGEKIIKAKEQELTERLSKERPHLSSAQVMFPCPFLFLKFETLFTH